MGHSRDQVVQTLLDTGVVAVVRMDQPAELTRLARALAAGGVKIVEITMTVPNALRAIETAVAELDGESIIGAGTVLDVTTARQAISAGAGVIVSPTFDPDVVSLCRRYGVAVIPGCLTPNEIMAAWTAGADVVKLFPGRLATPEFFADLKGPFPSVRLMPTGNVDLQTTPQYIRAGAVAVGVGKALVDSSSMVKGEWATITRNALDFRTVVDQARGTAR